jgi:hypothetical protein
MKPSQVWLLLLACLVLLGPVARAQDITIFAGGLVPGKVTFNNLPTTLDRGPIFGARVSTPFAAFLKLEYTLAFSNDFMFPDNVPGVTSAKGFLLNGNLLANIPLRKVVPYATAGVGLIHQYGSSNLPIGTKFAINYGGGLKFPKMLGPAGLRIDARGYTATGVFSHSVNLFELSGGVLFSF